MTDAETTTPAADGGDSEPQSTPRSSAVEDFRRKVEAQRAQEQPEKGTPEPTSDDAKNKAEDAGKDKRGAKPKPEADPKKSADSDDDSGAFKPSRRQVEMAKSIGYSDDEIAEMTEPEIKAAERAATKNSQKMSELGRRLQEAEKAGKTKADDDDDAGNGEDDDADTDGSSTDGDDGKGETLFTFTEDNLYDGETAAEHLNAMRDDNVALRKELDVLRTEMQELLDAETSRATDNFFASLDAETFSRFGDGPTDGLTEDSPEMEARMAVMDKAAELRVGHRAIKGRDMPLRRALDEALRLVAADDIQRAAEQQVQTEARTGKRTARPTQRRTPPQTFDSPEDEAKAKIRREAQRQGIRLEPG